MHLCTGLLEQPVCEGKKIMQNFVGTTYLLGVKFLSKFWLLCGCNNSNELLKFLCPFQFMQQSPGGSKFTDDIKSSKTPNTGISSGPTDVLGNIGM